MTPTRRLSQCKWTQLLPPVLALLTVMAVAACSQADYQLLVRNHTTATWLIRVAMGDGTDRVLVRAISPDTEGLAIAWTGPADTQIELLKVDCSIAGVFETSGPNLVAVPGVEGLDGTLEPYRFNAQWNVPGIAAVSNCGGFVFQ